MSGIKHFRSRLEGRPFQLWTDHKPLIFALRRVSLPTPGRQQRHLAFISESTNQLVYVPGTSNVVADALSRPVGGRCRGCPGLRSHHRQVAPGSQGHGPPPDPLPKGTSSPFQPRAVHHHTECRRPGSHLRLIHQHLPPAGAKGPPATDFLTSPRDRPPWLAGDPPPHLLQVCMERSLHRCHRLGEGLPGLPAGQGPPPCTGTSSTHPVTHPRFQPHPHRPSGPPAVIQRFYLSVHHH
jgi:hypothetical protein